MSRRWTRRSTPCWTQNKAPRAQFGRPYRREVDAKAFLQHAQRYSAKAIEYVKVVCNYIYDTYGRFPAHVDAFYLPGVWVQFSHLELEYYEKLFASALYCQQARHDEVLGH